MKVSDDQPRRLVDQRVHRLCGNAGAVLQLQGLQPSRDSITDYLEDTNGAG